MSYYDHYIKDEKDYGYLFQLMEEVYPNKRINYLLSDKVINEYTNNLCTYCQNNDIEHNSDDLKKWWKEHREDDKRRLIKELDNHDLVEFTKYEKELLKEIMFDSLNIANKILDFIL